MKSKSEIITSAKRTLLMEADALQAMAHKVDETFADIVSEIIHLEGRVVITGIGKSAIIANKIVATLNSTGTPSLFMHAADAVHGDLGMIQKGDMVICLSKSGNTPEIKVLVPLLKRNSNKLVAIVGNLDSFLAKNADYVLDSSISEEACPNNLAPTTSTTAQLAMGDALAVALLESREFSSTDFAKYHPGGALGKRLYLKVEDVIAQSAKPFVDINAKLSEIIIEISSKRLGATAVLENNELRGVITDGDLRRMMEKSNFDSNICAKDIMNASPKTIDQNEMAIAALDIIRENNISQLIVVKEKKYAGIIHLHDLLKEGII